MVELDDKARMILWIIFLVGGCICLLNSIVFTVAWVLWTSQVSMQHEYQQVEAARYAVTAAIFLIIGIVLIVLAILIKMEKIP